MKPWAIVELAIICLPVMAPGIWVSWVVWKISGREDFLRRIAHRCEIHDRPTPLRIKQLEAELGMGPSLSSRDAETAAYTNPRLTRCRHPWCSQG